jgi:hypothetical protein
MASTTIGVVNIPADKLWFPAGLQLQAGVTYTFEAQGERNDDRIKCGPQGYELTKIIPEWQ